MLSTAIPAAAARADNAAAAVPIRAVTRGCHHHFGYYDKSPWDATGRYMLAMRTPFMDRPPEADDVAVIGMLDLECGDENDWTPLAETTAWNWQQGCMLQWLGTSPEIVFNDRRDGRFIARVLNVHTGRERVLDRPVYGVNRTGTAAVSLNFARLHHQRPGYGYAGVPDAWRHQQTPGDDGLYAMDLASGASRLILSLAEIAEFERKPEFAGKMHRFNHVQFGADPERFAFLHRYKDPAERSSAVGQTRLCTLGLEGKKLRCLSDHGLVSHYDWRGGDAILAWARRHDEGDHYFLFPDEATASPQCIGRETLPCDGHCSWSPDGKWILTDTYPDETNYRTLILFHPASGERVDIGRFYSPPVQWQIRCDLHPRWNRDGSQVCIDSVHEGTRQMYALDVSSITSSTDFAGTSGKPEQI